MIIDSLHKSASAGNKESEIELFRYLTDRFRLFVQLRISDREDAEDIVQSALTTIAEKFREIEYRTSFAAWAYKVLENKLRDYYKSQRRKKTHFERVSEPTGEGVALNVDPTVRQQMLECLKKVGQANTRFARIINLHYQGYTTEEICRRLSLQRGYFYVVLSRARTMLEQCLEHGKIRNDD